MPPTSLTITAIVTAVESRSCTGLPCKPSTQSRESWLRQADSNSGRCSSPPPFQKLQRHWRCEPHTSIRAKIGFSTLNGLIQKIPGTQLDPARDMSLLPYSPHQRKKGHMLALSTVRNCPLVRRSGGLKSDRRELIVDSKETGLRE